MIKLDGIEIHGFVIHSDEFMKTWDEQINKISYERDKYKSLLIKYREHIAWHEGIDYLRDSLDESDHLNPEEIYFIKSL